MRCGQFGVLGVVPGVVLALGFATVSAIRACWHAATAARFQVADDGTGEPLAIMLRAGNAGSNTAADHKQVLAAALA